MEVLRRSDNGRIKFVELVEELNLKANVSESDIKATLEDMATCEEIIVRGKTNGDKVIGLTKNE